MNCGFVGDGATWDKTEVGWCLATWNLLTKSVMVTLPRLGTLLKCKVRGAPEVIFRSSLWAAQVGELSECGVGMDSWTQAVKITSFNIRTPLTKYFLLRAKEFS